MPKYFQYYVEGECEKQLIDELKRARLVEAGKVHVLNVKEEPITSMHLRTLKPFTSVVLVFDTDTKNTKILERNIQFFLSHRKIVKEVICLPQVKNLEDEIVRSTDISNIKELLNCKTIKDHKKAFCSANNLYEKLMQHGFDIKRMWVTDPGKEYNKALCLGEKIKL